MDRIISGGVIAAGERFVNITLSYNECTEALHTFVAELNHNLNPDPDRTADEVSWNDELDLTFTRFNLAVTTRKLYKKLSARGATMQVYEDRIEISLPAKAFPDNYARLVAEQVLTAIHHALRAHKLEVSANMGRPVLKALRDCYHEGAEVAVNDMVCTLAILDN